MNIKTFYFNPYRECTYVLSVGEKVLIIDPGMYSDTDERRWLEYMKVNNLTPILALITHTHPDHICGIDVLRTHYPDIAVLGKDFPAVAGCSFPLEDDGFIEMVDLPMPIYVIHTPGHKPDSVCFFFPEDKALFTGDTLFCDSVGRTDLPGGDENQLFNSLAKLKIKSTYLACYNPPTDIEMADIHIFPGHGPASTMQQEIDNNPFMPS